MKSWFIIPLVLIVVGASGYVLYNNQLVRTQVQNLASAGQEIADQPNDSVVIKNFAFGSKTVTIRAGDSVTWTNEDAVAHTATSDEATWDTGLIAKGESKSIFFAAPGTYTYHCTPHPSMTATIVVK